MVPTDTDATTLARMDELYRRMTPAEKLQKVRELTLVVNGLALAGLRDRYPDDPEARLLLRLARQRLGAELFERVYPGTLESD
jgi:hypothetical protein